MCENTENIVYINLCFAFSFLEFPIFYFFPKLIYLLLSLKVLCSLHKREQIQFIQLFHLHYSINTIRDITDFTNVKKYFKTKLWGIQFVVFILLKTSKLSNPSSWPLLNSLLESPLYFLIKCLLLSLDFLNTFKGNLWLMTVRTYWSWRTNTCFTS